MRLRVDHQTRFQFGAPTRSIIQSLRLNPRNHEGQHVADWRIDVDADCRLKESEDAFGNWTHMLSAEGPLDTLQIAIGGEVEIFDTAGVLREAAERLPVDLFLRDTRLTSADKGLRDFADATAGHESETLSKLHALLDQIHTTFKVESGSHADTHKLADVVAARAGTSADLAHVFIAAARHFAVPARCVGGYCLDRQGEGSKPQELTSAQSMSLHLWAEAHVSGIGWIGFDPSCGYCPRDTHVRVAVGLDGLGASPIRCAGNSGSNDTVDSKIFITAV